MKADMSDEAFLHIQQLMENQLGIKTPDSKRTMVESRLNQRLRHHNLNDYDQYVSYLESDEGQRYELPVFIDLVTTHKTSFFREYNHFTELQDFVLNYLLIDMPETAKIRIWCAAASTGQEPYSIAMVMDEILSEKSQDFSILATDVSPGVLKIAKHGVYNEAESSDIPERYLRRYILRNKEPGKRFIRVKPDLREKVHYKVLNLTNNYYMLHQQFDIIFCRNVLIYFNRSTQEKIISNLYNHTLQNGILVLGKTEGNLAKKSMYKPMVSTLFRKSS